MIQVRSFFDNAHIDVIYVPRGIYPFHFKILSNLFQMLVSTF